MERKQRIDGYSRSKMSFRLEKANAITTAKQLFYPSSVIEELKNCSSREDIDRILTTARKRSGD